MTREFIHSPRLPGKSTLILKTIRKNQLRTAVMICNSHGIACNIADSGTDINCNFNDIKIETVTPELYMSYDQAMEVWRRIDKKIPNPLNCRSCGKTAQLSVNYEMTDDTLRVSYNCYGTTVRMPDLPVSRLLNYKGSTEDEEGNSNDDLVFDFYQYMNVTLRLQGIK